MQANGLAVPSWSALSKVALCLSVQFLPTWSSAHWFNKHWSSDVAESILSLRSAFNTFMMAGTAVLEFVNQKLVAASIWAT